MRPTIPELIAGIIRTLNTTALPMALNSGDREAFLETLAATRLLSFVETRWDREFGRLMDENMTMQSLLQAAADALRDSNHPAAEGFAEGLNSSGFDMRSLPSISSLHEQNIMMKERLDRFILIHAAMPEGGSPGLNAVRQDLRAFLKEITRRGLEAAEMILTP